MNKSKILKEIQEIEKNNELTLIEKEYKIHDIERRYQNVFIKTDLCPNCNHLTIDVWFKEHRLSIEGKDMKHRPPKKNFGTLDENIDEKGEFNP